MPLTGPVEKLPELMNPVVSFVTDEMPEGFCKDQALSKLQEAVWWLHKGFEDQNLPVPKPREVAPNARESFRHPRK